jgi:hypothetical protein
MDIGAHSSPKSAQLLPMVDRPAELPPPGVEPNLINPVSMKLNGEVCLYLTFALSTLVLAVHIFSQRHVTRKFRLEDWLLLLTWVSPHRPASPLNLLKRLGRICRRFYARINSDCTHAARCPPVGHIYS